ncbi:subtilisin-like protease PR1F [Beauveria bassiana ARSEF 2860]|uniref:Subtilisin-like protease PR1F n=1 Tax=Beauveria bassiana (strain ARSEF 2860) TaxID=655819 RepID=J5J9Z3_BEAB2|nr:subtilisin-like protease PR1F [Beauveria bassiana ARSEF 2860]EJP60891.1 subtilisin-like protease PR1F [Beauveria bassiana ARSEF 2860]
MKSSVLLAMLLGLASADPTPAAEPQIQLKAPWNLRTISHREKPRFASVNVLRNFKYYYQSWTSGDTYYAYVIDSGVRISHKEFEGRAENLWTAYKTSEGKNDFEDKNGHGTHVAGIVAAKTYGVAKTAKVIAVRVLDEKGGGTTAAILKGMEQAIADIARKDRHNHAVINMSIGMPCSTAINTVIDRAYSRRDDSQRNPAGILFIVCSGNEAINARDCSPASARQAITVGAVNPKWNVVSWSNFGSTVDILAPGIDIVSLSNKSDTETATKSGTSMATPHVAALALNAMAVFSKISTQVRWFLAEETATKDKIQGDLGGAPNRLVNNNNSKQDSCKPKEPKNEKEDDEC